MRHGGPQTALWTPKCPWAPLHKVYESRWILIDSVKSSESHVPSPKKVSKNYRRQKQPPKMIKIWHFGRLQVSYESCSETIDFQKMAPNHLCKHIILSKKNDPHGAQERHFRKAAKKASNLKPPGGAILGQIRILAVGVSSTVTKFYSPPRGSNRWRKNHPHGGQGAT